MKGLATLRLFRASALSGFSAATAPTGPPSAAQSSLEDKLFAVWPELPALPRHLLEGRTVCHNGRQGLHDVAQVEHKPWPPGLLTISCLTIAANIQSVVAITPTGFE
ncbi:uncharacterized protein LOC124651364 [Lolium rigidum]|uniref:uncharacterized protein LOC124651364 n=1 Tax=Lolium rigidum TaxID=89674 RepID=UPI001F5C63CE|nr:uncharacterized protein LOC124651364 [Lolium rigidum]